MSLNPNQSADSHNWNYTKPDNDRFALSITGTVKAIQEVQAMNFGSDGRPTTPAFWENSNQPKMNIRLVLCGPSGGFLTWTFTPASKAAKEGKKRSVHLDLFALAGGVNMMNLLEKTIRVTTVAPPNGFNFGVGNPRPWTVELVTDRGPFQLKEPLDPIFQMPVVLANQAVSGGVMQPPPMMQPAPQVAETAISETPFAAAVPMPPLEDAPF